MKKLLRNSLYPLVFLFRFCAVFPILFGFNACGPIDYGYIGNWEQQSEFLMYENPRHQIRLRFPNEQWQVYSRPPIELEEKWETPSERWPISYHLLMANFPPSLSMELRVQPIVGEVSFNEFLALKRFRLLVNEYEVQSKEVRSRFELDAQGRNVGLIRIEYVEEEMPMIQFQAVYKEIEQFTIFIFSVPKSQFEIALGQIWEIINSYRMPYNVMKPEEYS